jgi:DNA adenine methylase
MRHQSSSTLATELLSKAVRPPPAPYIGGKRNLSRRLCALIDATPHDTYVEPFVGMGGVFLKRTRQPRAEVINDISADVTTSSGSFSGTNPRFMDVLKWQITSRAEFERLLAPAPERLTDLERAARFLSLRRLSLGGKVDGRNFGVDRRTPARFDVTKLAPMLDELHARLAGVVIERDYGPGVFEPADFERLADQLEGSPAASS